MVVYLEKDRVKARLCTSELLAAGSKYCREHYYAQEFLAAGSKLGYPEIQVGGLIIGSGFAGWSAYAEYMPPADKPIHIKIWQVLTSMAMDKWL